MEGNFMTYKGNLLFHYTKFEAALKIVSSKKIRFGCFDGMNDIAEVKRDVISNIDESSIQELLKEYQSISFTLDNQIKRGFEIDSLWGYYADRGNGVCLAFYKKTIETHFKKQFENDRIYLGPIEYLKDYTNLVHFEDCSIEELENSINKRIKDIFYTKSVDWTHEQEYRFVVKRKGFVELMIENSLKALILCMPKCDTLAESIEYKILKRICDDIPILHYTTNLGNKELRKDGELLYPIYGIDSVLDEDTLGINKL